MASLPDDNRFLLLKGLRQTLHLAEQEDNPASSETASQASDQDDAKGDASEEGQTLRRRSDRARATSAVGLGCHIDRESAVPLPSKLEPLGKALTLALDEAADARPAFQALVAEGYASAATAPVTSQFILRSFANDLSSLSKLVTSETLLSELRQGSSLLAQAMALRWDLTGETRALQQLANAFVASKSELTNATAAEFGLALATAIALSQPEVTDRLLAFASEHIADDADPGLIRDALHCMDAGRLLQTMPAVIQSVWQQRLRFADRNWNWDTAESRRVLNSLGRVMRPDSLSLPLFKRIVPDELWSKMLAPGSTFAVEPSSSTSDDPPSEEFRIEEATPVPSSASAEEKKTEPEAKSPPVSSTEIKPAAPETKTAPSEATKRDAVAEQGTSPHKTETVNTSAASETTSTPAPPSVTAEAEKRIGQETKPEPKAATEPKVERLAETPVSKTEASAAANSKTKPSSPAHKAKLEPTTDAPTKADSPRAPEAATKAKGPASHHGFLTFVAGAVGGLLVAFAVWSALPPKLQTLASAASIEPEPSALATSATPAAQAPRPSPPAKVEPEHPYSAPAPAAPAIAPQTPPSPSRTVAIATPPPAPTPVSSPRPEPVQTQPSAVVAPPPAKPQPPTVVTPPPTKSQPAKLVIAKTEPTQAPSAAPASSKQPAPEPQRPAAPKAPPAPVATTSPKPAVTPPAPQPTKPEPTVAAVSKPEEMAGPPSSAAPQKEVVEVKPTPPPTPTPAPPPSPAPPMEPTTKASSQLEVAPPFEVWKQKRVVELLSEHPSMKDWAFTAQNRSLRDSTHLILGKHPLIPHKSPVHQALLTLLVLDPPKDPDAARASLNLFSRVCPPTLCLEVWEPMVEAKVPQTDDIRRAAGVMAELMSIQLTAATRQRLERLAHGK